jgi:hypothetical protein
MIQFCGSVWEEDRKNKATTEGYVCEKESLLTVLVEATPAAAEVHIEQGDVKSGWIGQSMPAVIAERVGAYRIIEILSPGQGKDLGVVLFGEGESALTAASLSRPEVMASGEPLRWCRRRKANAANFRIRTLGPTRFTGTVEQVLGAGVLPRKEERVGRTRDLRYEFLADSHLEIPHLADCYHKRIGSADHAVLIVRYEVVQRERFDHVRFRN